MPNIKSAKKKMRQDVKRTKANEGYAKAVENITKKIAKAKTGFTDAEAVKKAYSSIDKAAKKKVIHKNKAARLKSRVSRMVKSK